MFKLLSFVVVLGAVSAYGHTWSRRGRHDEPRHHDRHHSIEVAPNCTCTLSDSPRFQKFLTTSCGKRFLETRQVCGSDNVTYTSKCDFLNSQVKDPALGKRCHGACPCNYDHHVHEHKKNHKVIPEFGWPKHSRPICLNNGVTVSGWRQSKEALKADSQLGVRCQGQCNDCQTGPFQCPVDWAKIKSDAEKRRPKPPNCVCPKSAEESSNKQHHHICANDGTVYVNMCELINNQTTKPKLGFRCFGKCPCKHQSDPTQNMLETEKIPTALINVTDDQNSIEDFSQSADQDQVREIRDVEWNQGHHSRHHRRHHHRRRHMTVCLTNGQTMRGWRDIFRALVTDSTLGIRCKGHCDWCLAHAKCPRFPQEKHMGDVREHEKYRMFQLMESHHGHRWGEEARHHGWNHKCE